MWDGILAGTGVATFTGGLALIALHWAYDKGNQAFLVAFMGGMIFRLLLVVVLSAVVISFTKVHTAAYAVSLIVTYLFFLGLEIFYALSKRPRDADAQSPLGQ